MPALNDPWSMNIKISSDGRFQISMARHHLSGNSGKWFELAAHAVATITNIVPRLGAMLDTIGSISGFRFWAMRQGDVVAYRQRETLWAKEFLPRVTCQDGGALVEFGVAFGEGMRWWTSNVDSPNFRFIGFDRFLGLPRPWRDMPIGAFDAGGIPPSIDDGRVEWVIGDLESTIIQFDWTQLNGPKIFIFDLDLFGVSRLCLDSIMPHLGSGDLLFFDEAFDADERTLINDVLVPTQKFRILAISPLGAAYEFI
jgi:hypothetical protein